MKEREMKEREKEETEWKLQTDLHIGGLAASAGKTD